MIARFLLPQRGVGTRGRRACELGVVVTRVGYLGFLHDNILIRNCFLDDLFFF